MGKRTTVIIPAAGRSSRFPDMRPKWLLTHPSGSLMLELAVNPFIRYDYDIVLATTEEFSKKYEVPLILEQLFGDRIRLVEIPYQTSGPVETISYAIRAAGIQDAPVIIKDVDNYIDVPEESLKYENFCVGVDVHEVTVERLTNKSFIIRDSNDIIQDIIEKKIISDTICVGVYGFHSAAEFLAEAEEIMKLPYKGEIYVSHLISSMILKDKVFMYVKASAYKDWGTINEWSKEMNGFQTLFCDFDGVLVQNKGKFGSNNWYTHSDQLIAENIELLKALVAKGATLIITTSRPKTEEGYIRELLTGNGLSKFEIVCGLPHSRRLLINDFSNTNPYPSAIAINIERNGLLKNLLNHNI